MTADETNFRARLLQDMLHRLREVTDDPAVLEAVTMGIIGFPVDKALSSEDVVKKRVDEMVTHKHATEVLDAINKAFDSGRAFEPRRELDWAATNDFIGLVLGRRVVHIGTRDAGGWRGWTIGFEGGTVLGYGQPCDSDAPVQVRAAMLTNEEYGKRAMVVLSEKKP